MIEAQELYCHACDRHVQFNLDMDLDGNHVLECPNCGHEHCRVVKEGKITDDRWAQRNGPTYTVVASSSSTASITLDCSGTSNFSTFGAIAWANATTTSGTGPWANNSGTTTA